LLKKANRITVAVVKVAEPTLDNAGFKEREHDLITRTHAHGCGVSGLDDSGIRSHD
jgi:hypothetical protein